MPAATLNNETTLARLGDTRVGGIYAGDDLLWGELPVMQNMRIYSTGMNADFQFDWYDGYAAPGVSADDYVAEVDRGGGWKPLFAALVPEWSGALGFWIGPTFSATDLPPSGATWQYRLTIKTRYGERSATCSFVTSRDGVPPPEDVTLFIRRLPNGNYASTASWSTHLEADQCEAEYSVDFGGTWLPCDTFPHPAENDRRLWFDDIVHEQSGRMLPHYFRCRAHEEGQWSDWAYADTEYGAPFLLEHNYGGVSSGKQVQYGTCFVANDYQPCDVEYLELGSWMPSIAQPIDLYPTTIEGMACWQWSTELCRKDAGAKEVSWRVRSQDRSGAKTGYVYWHAPAVLPPYDLSLRVSGGGMTTATWKTVGDINSCEAQIGTDGTSWVASTTQPYRVSEAEWACEPISLYGSEHYYRVRCFSADRNDWSGWVVYRPQGA